MQNTVEYNENIININDTLVCVNLINIGTFFETEYINNPP